LCLAVVAPAVAQTPAINAARQQGRVGERFDGYIGYAVTPPAALRSQVDSINIQRRALYTNFAQSRRVTPYEVQITAGCQLLARVRVGEAYLLSDGRWRRRVAGQPMVMPEYCG
jgi:uncharacterized protein YdbL (DUF1318 family)